MNQSWNQSAFPSAHSNPLPSRRENPLDSQGRIGVDTDEFQSAHESVAKTDSSQDFVDMDYDGHFNDCIDGMDMDEPEEKTDLSSPPYRPVQKVGRAITSLNEEFPNKYFDPPRRTFGSRNEHPAWQSKRHFYIQELLTTDVFDPDGLSSLPEEELCVLYYDLKHVIQERRRGVLPNTSHEKQDVRQPANLQRESFVGSSFGTLNISGSVGNSAAKGSINFNGSNDVSGNVQNGYDESEYRWI